MEFCVSDDTTIDGINYGFTKSQNYPDPYDGLLDCSITFLPAQHELSMALYVHDFHLERNFDFLNIASSYGTYQYHGNGANIAANPEAMQIGKTYYCELIPNTSAEESYHKMSIACHDHMCGVCLYDTKRPLYYLSVKTRTENDTYDLTSQS